MNAMIINVQERRDRERGIHNHSKIGGLQRRQQQYQKKEQKIWQSLRLVELRRGRSWQEKLPTENQK